MHAEQVKALLDAELESCKVEVEGEGSSFQIVVVGAVFEELNAVKKQQLVYSALSGKIADGSIHAVTIKAYTPEEWSAH